MDMSKIEIIEHTGNASLITSVSGGPARKTITLWSAVQAIGIAKSDPKIGAIFIKADNPSIGLADAQELRKALSDFRESGKRIFSYVESPSTKSYYLASVADSLFITANHGDGHVSGISTDMIFLKDILDTLGIDVRLIRHGKYKSAGEMYVRSEPSKENLEQTEAMVSSIWESIASEISSSRSIEKKKLDSLIDNLVLRKEDDYVANSLADRMVTSEEMRRSLGVNSGDVQLTDFSDYVKSKVSHRTRGRNRIAIIYADGSIVNGNGMKNVAGDRLSAVIASVRADSTIKGVIFRVDSPGGAVLASEKIKEEIDLMRKVKPVVASYGNYAASGGYLISNSCDRIFSNASTLTGSIGVFGLTYDISKTAKDILHINATTVGSNKHGDLGGLMFRPYDAEESAYLQASVDNVYDSFVSTVAKGRGLAEDYVDSIAQGRVWTGADALKLGLVDEIGTLEDAVAYLSGMINSHCKSPAPFRVVEYPVKPKSLMDKLMPMLAGANAQLFAKNANMLDNTVLGKISEQAATMLSEFDQNSATGIYARMPYVFTFQDK